MKKYFYSNGKEKHGPLGLDELKQEDISDETLIWFEGLDDWTPAGELDEIKPVLELQPPPILSEEKKGVTLSEGYLEYEKARDFILILKFTSRDSWNNYSKSVLKPGDIPARPEIVYEGIGWVSWEHWLGASYGKVTIAETSHSYSFPFKSTFKRLSLQKKIGFILIAVNLFYIYFAFKGGYELRLSKHPEESMGAILGTFPLAIIGIILIAIANRRKKRDEKNGVVRDKGSLR